MIGLQSFSDWVLSVLPRLFLYPGGLWLATALLGLRVASHGSLRSLRPITLARDFLSTQPLALAFGWVGVALLPLPGASALTFPADRLALVTLPLLSLAFDREVEGTKRGLWPSLAVTLALLATVAGGESRLLGSNAAWSPDAVLAMVTVVVGALAMWRDAMHNLAGGARLSIWLGMGALPMLAWPQPFLTGIVWASLFYMLLLIVIALSARHITRRVRPETLTLLVWALAIASLLFALLDNSIG